MTKLTIHLPECRIAKDYVLTPGCPRCDQLDKQRRDPYGNKYLVPVLWRKPVRQMFCESCGTAFDDQGHCERNCNCANREVTQ